MGNPPPDFPNIVDDWISWANWQREHANQGGNPFSVAYMELDWLVNDAPERAWETILDILADPHAEPILGTLAAGPLEDLLTYHGSMFIERVETRAMSDPHFATLLGGVWQCEMTDEIWHRVQAVWDRRGWDGIPMEP